MRIPPLSTEALGASDAAVLNGSQEADRPWLAALARVQGLPAALASVAAVIERSAFLEPTVREVAVIATVRRSSFEMAAAVAHAKAAGISGDLVEAIEDEDWTDPGFSARQKYALQYALKYDSSLGVQDAFFSELRSVFSEDEIIELTAVCALFSIRARNAIALGYGATA